ncbi:MAG: 4Fe-4S dicluster domain-containing protein [Chitinophagales bacterium]
MAKYCNFYDATKCTACRGCMIACKNWNRNPAVIEEFKGNFDTHGGTNAHTYTVIKFIEDEDVFGPKYRFLKFQCMHCENPACMDVCPRKAISKNEWGAVVKDYDKCIGCQYCSYACPFGVPKYDKKRDVVTKCTMCTERVNEGIAKQKDPNLAADEDAFKVFKPACSKTCPTGALLFGDREELLAQARERVEYLRANGSPNATIYGEYELGGLNNIFVLGDTPDKYGLPVNPKVSSVIPAWQNVIQPWFGLLVPLALAGSAVSFFTTRFLKAKQGDEHHEGEV